MSETQLKPCPFCGATDIEPWTDDYGSEVVFCRHCGTTGPQGVTQARAIRWWNTRKPSKELQACKEAIQSICDKFENIEECNECPIKEYGVCPSKEDESE